MIRNFGTDCAQNDIAGIDPPTASRRIRVSQLNSASEDLQFKKKIESLSAIVLELFNETRTLSLTLQ